MKRVIALILGGGQGKRLFPLTLYRSKPAVPIGGKYRLIDIPISNCLHSNIKDIYVLTQFNSESLNNHVNNTYRFDYFSRAFVRILAAEQTVDNTHWFQGTADAVRKNLIHLDLKGDEEILILSGDQLYNMDYRGLVDFHRRSAADFTVSVIPVNEGEARDFGILKLGRNGRISGFKEKPTARSELKDFKTSGHACCPNRCVGQACYIASMGVYIFNIRALVKALEGKDADFGKEVIPHSIRSLKGFGYNFNGYWKDIGTIKSFYEVNMEIASSRPQFSFFYDGSMFTRPRFLPSARIYNCRIDHSILTEGSLVSGASIKNSVIGLRSIIGRHCRITKTVMMGADYFEDPRGKEPLKIGVGDGSRIYGAIIDKNARIGRNVIIRNSKNVRQFDGESYFIRDGIVIIPKNAKIKDGTKI